MTSPNDVSSSDIPEFDSSSYNMDAATLTSLNLVLRDNQLKIEWPDNVNLFHMTVGQHLGPDSRDRTAMIYEDCLLYTSPSPRDLSTSRMPSSA